MTVFSYIRRIFGMHAIKRFLKVFLPKVDLGELLKIECRNFKLGNYNVMTSKGNYKLCFWELDDGARSFSIDLDERYDETIRFSISGLLSFDILPKNMIIVRNGKWQVINLRNGKARLYPLKDDGSECILEYIEYKKPILYSEMINVDKLIKVTREIRLYS